MNREEFKAATDLLGEIVLRHTASTFSNMSTGALQWLMLRVFGLWVSVDAIESECAKMTTPPCSECWSVLLHEDGVHDFKNKERMAALLLGLESAIADGVV